MRVPIWPIRSGFRCKQTLWAMTPPISAIRAGQIIQDDITGSDHSETAGTYADARLFAEEGNAFRLLHRSMQDEAGWWHPPFDPGSRVDGI